MKNALFMFWFILFSFSIAFGLREINVDFSHEKGVLKNLLGVNRKPAGKLQGYVEGGVNIIRMHDDRVNDYQYLSDFWNYNGVLDSFTTINESFDPYDSSHYHWEECDSVIHRIVGDDMDVYFRLGISWPSNSEYPTPPLTPPFDPDGKNFSKFAVMCQKFVSHYNDGWNGGLNAGIRYWEIWNEPGGEFWRGGKMDFYKMFHATFDSLKAYDPGLKIGGPGALPSAIVVPTASYYTDFLSYARDNGIELDFYSWHLYGTENPYGIKYFADQVRGKMDSLGFSDAESHVTEINYELGDAQKVMNDNAKGAAYLLSNLLAAQDALLDKMFWYPGLGLYNDDKNGQGDFLMNAYGFKVFSLMYENTPIRIEALGGDVVEGNWKADTTNFMVLASKSSDGNKVYVAVSNYNSHYENYLISVGDLPWTVDDSIRITKNVVKDPDDRFTESISYQIGGNNIQLISENTPSPSIVLYRLEKIESSGNDESWKFIVAPDLHNSEIFVQVWEQGGYENYRNLKLKEKTEKFKTVRERHGAELFVSPGDCNSGYWWRDDFKEQFRSVPEYTALSDEEIILKASELCYSALNEIIDSSGYEEFYMAVGDHEVGDDSFFRLPDQVAEYFEVYKKGFANYFTLAQPDGESRFQEPIGSVSCRPMGTPYENTSYAVQYKNVLFVTLDVFRYAPEEDPVVEADVTGEHLLWLENVLREGRKSADTDHIIVQLHTPVIYPVKKSLSSGLLLSGNSESELLKTLRDYHVDLFLAGEVHMNTVIQDPSSNVVQFVGRSGDLQNYAVVEVGKELLNIVSYFEDGSPIGELTIQKSGDAVLVEGSGDLQPVDPDGLQIHWTFEEKLEEESFSCSFGGFPDSSYPYSPKLSPSYDHHWIMNEGDFGISYSLLGEKFNIVNGIIGNAVDITEETKLFVVPMGPMYSGFPRTAACWIKTTANERALLLNSGLIWGKEGQFFNISLNNGRLELSSRPNSVALGNHLPVNDGEWHHVAVAAPLNGSLSDCRLYVDGGAVNDVAFQNGDLKINTGNSNIMAIATQSDIFQNDLSGMDFNDYVGLLDDFRLWTRALTDNEIRGIYDSVALTGLGSPEGGNTGGNQFQLFQNYPNPFHLSTRVEYWLKMDCHVQFKIYNIRGRLVRKLTDRRQKAGTRHVDWNGKDEWGNSVGSGIYYYSLEAGKFKGTGKMVLIK